MYRWRAIRSWSTKPTSCWVRGGVGEAGRLGARPWPPPGNGSASLEAHARLRRRPPPPGTRASAAPTGRPQLARPPAAPCACAACSRPPRRGPPAPGSCRTAGQGGTAYWVQPWVGSDAKVEAGRLGGVERAGLAAPQPAPDGVQSAGERRAGTAVHTVPAALQAAPRTVYPRTTSSAASSMPCPSSPPASAATSASTYCQRLARPSPPSTAQTAAAGRRLGCSKPAVQRAAHAASSGGGAGCVRRRRLSPGQHQAEACFCMRALPALSDL